MHCHLASCVREFCPFHSFWLFPFERYNGLLQSQPTSNRSIELQLMRHFQTDNLNIHIHHEAQQWPNAEHFLQALPDPPYDPTSPISFDQSIEPGMKYTIASLPVHLLECLQHFYSEMYPAFKEQILDNTIIMPSTFKKYCCITWHGKLIYSSLSRNCKIPYVFAKPPFMFASSNPSDFHSKERLVEIDFFLMHSIVLPENPEPKSHLLAFTKWPMVHPQKHHYGKLVEVWYTDIYEPNPKNIFLLASLSLLGQSSQLYFF